MISPWRGILERYRERKRARADRTVRDLVARYQVFRSLLDGNNRAIDLLADLELSLRSREGLADCRAVIGELAEVTGEMVERLVYLDGGGHGGLLETHQRIRGRLEELCAAVPEPPRLPPCLGLDALPPQAQHIAGSKAAALARIGRDGTYAVPAGFVVTVQACRAFLRHGGLQLRLAEILQPHLADEFIPGPVADKVREEIGQAALPPDLAEALRAAGEGFFARGAGLAVRSSSIAEDGKRHSFAGQYATVLNVVDGTGLERAFRTVVASAFSSRSLAYRRQSGLDVFAFDMAVLCLEMVRTRAAGVLLTRAPGAEGEVMLVSAVYGLGEAAVSGAMPADLYFIDRQGRIDRTRSAVAAKTRELVCLPSGGVGERPVDLSRQRVPALEERHLALLAQWGLVLEERESGPQDVEWALAETGTFHLLQARPLTMPGGDAAPGDAASLASGAVRASSGHGTGMVHLARSRKDLELLPDEPIVLVLHQSLPDATAAVAQAAAILVDLGNPADHLSLVARENGIPMLCGLGDATSRFTPGTWLTVDGGAGTVREAAQEAIDEARRRRDEGTERPSADRRPEDPATAEVRELTLPLNLTDAYGPTFASWECRSLHDIVRYVHEKAVLAMFKAGDAALEEGGVPIRAVDLDVPFTVHLIDLGGGLAPAEKPRRRVPPGDVTCLPLRALLKGITTPGLRWGPMGAVNVGSVVSRWMTDGRSARPLGMPNYAIVSRDYLSLNARMDFHFTTIDAVCGPVARSNYVRFRFKGGGTLPVQRERRARCIGIIMEANDFFTFVRSDLVNASLQSVPAARLEEALVVLGRLLGFTRLLDAAMADEENVERVARAFLEGNYGIQAVGESGGAQA